MISDREIIIIFSLWILSASPLFMQKKKSLKILIWKMHILLTLYQSTYYLALHVITILFVFYFNSRKHRPDIVLLFS